MKVICSKTTSEFCKLCLMEKLYILNAFGDERCLNKISEFINKCRHQNKLLLKNVKYGLIKVCFVINSYTIFSFRTSRNVHLMNVQYLKLRIE